MKYIFKEEAADYNLYKFPYSVYGQAEESDNYDELLDLGFLPTRMAKDMFYKARSVRIDLQQFAHSSENRRIAGKITYLALNEIALPAATLDTDAILSLAERYYAQKFGKQVISSDAFRRILKGDIFTHLLEYTDRENNRTVGYTVVFRTETSAYYAYPVYDMTYLDRNIGIGMMQLACDFYQQQKFHWLYVGTAYTTASRYKLQFEPLHWHSGNSWQTDIASLKSKLA